MEHARGSSSGYSRRYSDRGGYGGGRGGYSGGRWAELVMTEVAVLIGSQVQSMEIVLRFARSFYSIQLARDSVLVFC